LSEEALTCITGACVPGKYAVDILPFLKYLPEWFPGGGFHKEAREGRELLARFFRQPFEASKEGTVRQKSPIHFILIQTVHRQMELVIPLSSQKASKALVSPTRRWKD
jgi:hypothetical protein